jgi:hypothetical protein
MTDSEQHGGGDTRKWLNHLDTVVLALGIVGTSLGVAVYVPMSNPETLSTMTGAAWAWSIGAATALWVIPWAKENLVLELGTSSEGDSQ